MPASPFGYSLTLIVVVLLIAVALLVALALVVALGALSVALLVVALQVFGLLTDVLGGGGHCVGSIGRCASRRHDHAGLGRALGSAIVRDRNRCADPDRQEAARDEDQDDSHEAHLGILSLATPQ